MKYYCKECGHALSPVEAMLGNICGKCARKAHKAATQKQPPKGKKIA